MHPTHLAGLHQYVGHHLVQQADQAKQRVVGHVALRKAALRKGRTPEVAEGMGNAVREWMHCVQ